MSTRELERVEILGRVRSRELKLKDAAAMLQLSYRQAKPCGNGTGRWGAVGCSMGMRVELRIAANQQSFDGKY
jgi:hypothetical protein